MSPLSKVQHRTPTLLEPLPSLTNMHAVAMVSVDTESEKLRVQRFAGKGAARNQEVLKQRRIQDFQGSIPRSKSLLNIKLVAYYASYYCDIMHLGESMKSRVFIHCWTLVCSSTRRRGTALAQWHSRGLKARYDTIVHGLDIALS